MEDRKTTLDRERLSSDYIQGKQDFNHVLKIHRAMKPPLWKTAWFYGPVGLAIVAITISAVKFNPQLNKSTTYGANNTLEQKNTQEPTNTVIAAIAMSDKEQIEKTVETAYTSIPQKKSAPKKSVLKKETIAIVKEIETPQTEIEPAREIEPVQYTQEVKKTSTRNMMPTIGGVFMGNIKSDQLCSSEGIWINEDWIVTGFTIQYNNGAEDVIQKINGAVIPESICWKIHRFNLNIPVFITSIVAIDPTGARKSIPSMSLTPVY